MSSRGLLVQVVSEMCPYISSCNCRRTCSAKWSLHNVIKDCPLIWLSMLLSDCYHPQCQSPMLLYHSNRRGEDFLLHKETNVFFPAKQNQLLWINTWAIVSISPRIHSQYFMLLFTRSERMSNLKWVLIWNYGRRRGRFDLLKNCLWWLCQPPILSKHLSERWTFAS